MSLAHPFPEPAQPRRVKPGATGKGGMNRGIWGLEGTLEGNQSNFKLHEEGG